MPGRVHAGSRGGAWRVGNMSETTWLSGLTAQHARREAKHRAHLIRLQDGLAVLMTGVLACGIGLTVLGAWLGARAGHPIAPWSERVRQDRASVIEPAPPDEPFGVEALHPGAMPVEIAAPTAYSAALSLLGTLLAAAGITAAQRQRRGMPLLCAVAIVLCWVPTIVAFLEELVLLRR